MALVWQNGTRSATFDRGKWQGTQNYIVYDDAGAAINVYDLASTGPPTAGFGGGQDPQVDTFYATLGHPTRQRQTGVTAFGTLHIRLNL